MSNQIAALACLVTASAITACDAPQFVDPYEVVSVDFTPGQDVLADGSTKVAIAVQLTGSPYQDVELAVDRGTFLHRKAGDKVKKKANQDGVVTDTIVVGRKKGSMQVSVKVAGAETFYTLPLAAALPEALAIQGDSTLVGPSDVTTITAFAQRGSGGVSAGVPIILEASAGRFILKPGVKLVGVRRVQVPLSESGTATVAFSVDQETTTPSEVNVSAETNGSGGTPIRASTVIKIHGSS